MNKKLLKELLHSLNKKANRGHVRDYVNTRNLIEKIFDTTTCCDNPEMTEQVEVLNMIDTPIGLSYAMCKNCKTRG